MPKYGFLFSMSSYPTTPTAKKSEIYEYGYLINTYGAIYPGVPLESYFPIAKSLTYFAIPKSVNLTYPVYYNTKFYGLISL